MGTLFTMKGRLSRKQYIVWSVSISIIAYALAFVIGLMAGLAGMDEQAGTGLGFLIGIVFGVIQSFLVVRRFHDLDKPGWHYWLCWVPLYGIYLSLVLLFAKGSDGTNQYGPDPTLA